MPTLRAGRDVLGGETVGFVTVATFATAGFTAAAGVLMTRAIEPASRGRIAATLAVGLLAALFTTVGFDSAVRVLLPRLPAAAVRSAYARIGRRVVPAGLLAGVAAGAYITAVLPSAGVVDVAFLGVLVPLSTAVALARGATYAEGRANLAAAADAIGAMVQAGAAATVALLRPEVPLFYLAYLFGVLVPAVIYAVPMKRWGWLSAASDSEAGESARRMLRNEATKLFVGRMAMAMTYRLDRVLLAALSSPEQLGYYAAAVAVADVAILFPTAVSQVIWRRAAQDEHGGSPHRPGILRPFLGAVAAAAVVALVVAAASEALVPLLYGAEYGAAAGPLRVLAFGSFFIAVWRILATDLLARGHGALFTTGACLSLAITVVGCAALIPRQGAVGAAVASLAAYVVAAGLAVHWSRQRGVLRAQR